MDPSIVDTTITLRKHKREEYKNIILLDVACVVHMVISVVTWYHNSYFVKEPTLTLTSMESSNEKMTSKRKVLGKNNEETRSYFTWNLEMERVLADVLRNQRNLDNKGGRGWESLALNTAAAVLPTSFNRSWYGIVSDILGQSGFDWDGTKHMIIVENENTWNEYCTSHKSAK
ncbi:hypothetical protein HKD37_20G056207 [Glycine soja]